MKIKGVFFLICTLLSVAAFVVKETPFIFPSYFPRPYYNFEQNPLNSNVISLGRQLFFDPILSADSMISCASCHSPYNAFAHTDHPLSHGVNDQIGTRNAPTLFNLAWQQSFMWDGASSNLAEQALFPINHPKEMGETTFSVVNKLNKEIRYKKLFYNIYTDSIVTVEKMLNALAQFQLSLVSSNAKYDSVKQGEVSFSEMEKNGYRLFLMHCNACHTEPLFSNYRYANNGLKIDTLLNDLGRLTVTKKREDSLLFKIPSLRNLSYSYPYMHDGRFKKLSDVIFHYTNGIQQTNHLSNSLKKPIVLTPNDRVDLIAFLLTLNDKQFVFNAKHQYPSKK